jgi:hypothetical protein
MQCRNDETAGRAVRWLAAGALALFFAGCSTAPYRIEPVTDPPWEFGRGLELPALEPPLSPRAHRISICYGTAVNSEQAVLALAEKTCGGGRLVLEHQNAFWNGCSVLQPTRITYICDPPEEAATEN